MINPMMLNAAAISNLVASEPRASLTLHYGTAGFRSTAKNLPSCVLRCAMLMALRSKLTESQVGFIITASHNPEEDNGLKLINHEGQMLEEPWERWAEKLVNTDDVIDVLDHIVKTFDVKQDARGTVIIGRDTRSSSEKFRNIALKAVSALGVEVVDLGLVTTPLLQHIVRQQVLGSPTKLKDQYYIEKRSLFERLMKGSKPVQTAESKLIIDCANGVGYYSMTKFQDLVDAVCVNGPEDGTLNFECGADFVQKTGKMPKIYTKGIGVRSDTLLASLDGDADRLVLFKQKKGESIVLGDGDRCACLVAEFLMSQFRILGKQPSFAVAQTAYSDGGSTFFLKTLEGVNVVTTFTGVKHLEEALRSYDVGVYWEPNGHGNIVASKKFLHELDNFEEPDSDVARQSLEILRATLHLANQAVGDGVVNILLVFAILSIDGKSFEDWMQMYSPRENVNYTIKVEDKNVVKTEDYDRMVTEPQNLRVALKKLQSPTSRVFARKSGTEDIVRVFAEADTIGYATEIGLLAARAVWDTCNGTGERP